jgi:hypothetical protein
MRLQHIVPATLLAAATLMAVPAFAGQQHGHPEGRRGASAPQARGQAQPHAQAAPAPRPQGAAPGAGRAQGYAPRYNGQNNAVVGQAVPRGAVAPRYAPNYNNGSYHNAPNYRYAPNYHYAPYAPRYYAPHAYGYGYYAPRYYGPGYVFTPHLSIGFGFWAGYPVPYSYAYPYPVPVYGYAQPQTVVVNPGSSYGGISFQVTPYEADVYVDGNYAGHASDFDGSKQPMTLAAGQHHIEIVANGYQTSSFDVNVQAGQIIPYQGDLQR